MNTSQIAELLAPFLQEASLSNEQLAQVSDHLDLLLRWNTKISLTAVRRPEEIVSRHFGESFFAAVHLISPEIQSAIDLGSGAGFPGLPLAIYAPQVKVTLIESQNKKATFLKEIVRSSALTNVSVFAGRAEEFKQTADLVTMRAVEKFEQTAGLAAQLVNASGWLGLLIGAAQVESARSLLPHFQWQNPLEIPQSTARVLLIGDRA